MYCGKTLWFSCAIGLILVCSGEAQNANPPPSATSVQAPPQKGLTFDEFIDSAIAQERRLAKLMRNFKPVVETYIQEQKHDSRGQTSPRADQYFLSRLDLSGEDLSVNEFETPDHSPRKHKRKWKRTKPVFTADGFAQPLFPDLDHFDRQNYEFKFVRWELLGDVRCVALDVTPRENPPAEIRGFMGRIWIEDQDFNIARFTGTYTAKAFAKRSFHFDSWRLNVIGNMWLPAYIYSEEPNPDEAPRRGLSFKAQTRIWGYDAEHAGDHHEYAKTLTDNPTTADPNRHETSQGVSPELSLGRTTYTPEDQVVERLQVAGLMAPDGPVDRILEAVTNNLLITNDLDTAGIRCRVLLTTPVESFVIGHTIVLSRGLLDVLPDEASLAAVVAHELAHIVLEHSLGAESSSKFSVPFSDLEVFTKLNFRFDAAREAAADKKGQELFSKSPYKDKLANAALFMQAFQVHTAKLPNLAHSRFSNGFGSSHLIRMQGVANSPKRLRTNDTNQIAALPLGSRIKLDPWSDKIEMLKAQSPPLLSASEKRPFEVSPFFPYLKRPGEEKQSAEGTNP